MPLAHLKINPENLAPSVPFVNFLLTAHNQEWIKKNGTSVQWSTSQLSTKILSFAAKCLQLEYIMLNEISKKQMDKCCIFSLYVGAKKFFLT